MSLLRNCCLIAAVSLALSTASYAENWPQWRGPHGNGHSGETGLATTWSQTKNVAWRLPLPGPGGATPAVWEDRIFVISSIGSEDGAELQLLCVSTDGEKLWQETVGSGNKRARTFEGNSASPSPSTDGEHVWCFLGTGILACYDMDGNEVWKFDVQDRYGRIDIQFGMTSTPVLDGDDLYLQLIHGTWGSDYRVGKVVKLNKRTGEEIWAVDRPTEAIDECKHSYASPMLYDDGERRFLVTHGADNSVAHNLETGEEMGRLSGLNGPTELNKNAFDNTFRFVASPSYTAGTVIVPTCKEGPLVAVNVPRGDGLVRWTYPKSPDVSVPLIVDDLVYCVRKPGHVFCLDINDGEEQYYGHIHNAEHRASPIYADGHIYICARDGVCTVIKTGRDLNVVAENDIGDEPITASPAISNGTIYLRSFDALYAIRP